MLQFTQFNVQCNVLKFYESYAGYKEIWGPFCEDR